MASALSIGGAGPLNREHLARLKRVIDRYEPALFSEHLAWSTHDGVYLNDLLPVPYNAETLARVSDHVDEVQESLQRQMLLENPSTYVAFEDSTMSEVEFLSEIVNRTGCGLLLDVNNVYVSAVNHGSEPMAYLDQFPIEHVGEIHLAGHFEDRDDLDAPLLIDAHGTPVADAVWPLYARTLARIGRGTDADRMGQRRARLSGACRRGRARDAHHDRRGQAPRTACRRTWLWPKGADMQTLLDLQDDFADALLSAATPVPVEPQGRFASAGPTGALRSIATMSR